MRSRDGARSSTLGWRCRAAAVAWVVACAAPCGRALAGDAPAPVPAPAAPAPAPAVPPPAPKPAVSAAEVAARREAIERLERNLRRDAGGPYAEKKREEIGKDLDALESLGGADAAEAAIAALAFDDEAVEKRVLAFVETVHEKSLVKPLVAVLEHRDNRRRFRLHAGVAHALAVIADPGAIPALTELVVSEDPTVVAAAADALAVFKSAKHDKRVEPVKRMLGKFESTWNLKMSIRPEDRILTDKAKTEWEVFGAALRKSLQALTGQSQLTHPRQFREWWNDAKKKTNW
jgi:hypothetical protein